MSDIVARLNEALSGRYTVERELGQGGMATVYLANDQKHHRKVALKVLKPELAAVIGAERFLAEIRTTASLQHPHILPLFDSGEADKLLFYVMPHVEGESLRDRLDREHQLPVDEAVRIATNVAEALDYAHAHGVVHRDIKPANILSQAGKPVISDFGIALAVSAGGTGRLTETGLSLGTPHYMSPEQATGDLSVGPATDIWALGCVLYEMLAGEPPYTGGTPQAVLGKIITASAASAAEARRSVPENVDATIRKALEKVPADRFTSGSELAKALADPGFRHGAEAGAGAGARDQGAWKRLALAASAVAMISVGLASAVFLSRASAPPSPFARFTIPVSEGAEAYLGGDRDTGLGRPSSTSLALSRAGDLLIYSAWEVGPDGTDESRLYVRSSERERAAPIEGTEGGSSPFFSPDGTWIGFFAGPSLRRVPAAGGEAETIVQDALPIDLGLGLGRGATWADDGTIVYGNASGLYRVSASGGDPALVVATDTLRSRPFAQPHMLPGSRVLLFHGLGASLDPERAEVLALDLATGTRTTVLEDAMDPRYVETGHLLFMRRGTLMAVGFDPERVAIEGQPVVVLEDVMQALFMPNGNYDTGAAQLAVSGSGYLVYAPGGIFPEDSATVIRVRPDGRMEPLALVGRRFLFLRASPDGNRLAFAAGAGSAFSVFVHDLVRGVTQRLNTGGFSNAWPAWSPDGRAIAFTSDREGRWNVYRMPADGTGVPERLAPSTETQFMSSWSSAGVIAYVQGVTGQFDVWVLPPGGQPTPFLASAASEEYPTFSPDGAWLAYTSNETGGPEIYVRPYPGPGAATLISGEGGREPAWSRDGSRIYFVQPRAGRDPVMMVVDVTPGNPFRAGRAAPLIDPWPYSGNFAAKAIDVLADGSFVATLDEGVEAGGGEEQALLIRRNRYRVGELHVILNFFEELEARVPN